MKRKTDDERLVKISALPCLRIVQSTLKAEALKGDFIHMGYTRQRKGSSYLILGGEDGVDFVRCRICGDHRRVISGWHLSKHDTDRDEGH